MDIDKFPKISEVKNAIAKLQQLEFPVYSEGMDIDEFVKQITSIIENELGFIPNIKQIFRNNEFLSSFFRARELNSITNINLIREHSYPPLNFVEMGRCNFPNLPVFYCSDNALTALIEVIRNYKSDNKRYCISKWELIQSEDKLMFENFLQTELPEENNYNIFKEDFIKKINIPFEKSLNRKLEKEQEEGLIEYLKFLDSSFISNKNYSLSASLAYRALYANHNFRTDVLMYPSVQTFFKGVNLAMQPNFVENNLKLTRLYVVSLENFNPNTGKVKITFFDYAEVEKNVIMWKKIKLDDEHYNNIIKQDFGNIINGKFEKN